MTAHSCRIAFFDAKPYDRDSFNSAGYRLCLHILYQP